MRVCLPVCLVALACLTCQVAQGQIVASAGANGVGTQTNFEDFESYAPFSGPGNPFSSPGGFDFDLPSGGGAFVIWNGGGVVLPTNTLYQNGGAASMTSIKLTGGADIFSLEFDVGNGYGSNPEDVWIRAYDNGVYTGFEFDFVNTPAGTFTVTNAGTAFDEIRVQAWFAFANRAPNEDQFGAVSIDNIRAFTSAVPEPTVGLLSVLASAIGLARFRRRK